jgi:hypothetical protein
MLRVYSRGSRSWRACMRVLGSAGLGAHSSGLCLCLLMCVSCKQLDAKAVHRAVAVTALCCGSTAVPSGLCLRQCVLACIAGRMALSTFD